MSKRIPISQDHLPELVDRMLNRIAYTDSGCLEWTGSIDGSGYGTLSYGGARTTGKRRNLKTHRVMYEALVGPITNSLELDHLCRNRRCCHPRPPRACNPPRERAAWSESSRDRYGS